MKRKVKFANKLNTKVVKDSLIEFKREFKKHLTAFITGAFSFVAALLWRDAIQSILENYKNTIENVLPIKEIWFSKVVVAIAVTIIAVVAIILISKFLKE